MVRELRSSPGELTFQVEVAGVEWEIYFRTDAPVTPTADAALATCLMPAMRAGGTLSLADPLSARLVRTQQEYQAIQQLWSHDWGAWIPPLREVEVRAPTRSSEAPEPGRGVAAFFSGGVDSWSTVLAHPELTHLVFVRGMDLALSLPELTDEVEVRLRAAAAEVGLPLYVVETNVRELSDQLVPWEAYFGCALAAVALMHAPLFERFLMAGSMDYAVADDRGANPLVDHLWSTESLEVVHDGGRYSRLQRVERIAVHPVVQRSLRVCWENRGGAYNCGRCPKCLLTLVSLEALGMRGGMETFPPELDLDLLDEITLSQLVHVNMWQDVLDLVRTRRRDLEAAVGGVVRRGKEALGLPPDYRRRPMPGGLLTPDRPTAKGQPAEHDQPTSESELAARLDTVLNSRSWRMTKPLRDAARRARGRRPQRGDGR